VTAAAPSSPGRTPAPGRTRPGPSGTGFPALRTHPWAYSGVRDGTSCPAIGQPSTTRALALASMAVTYVLLVVAGR
jgi:hypothetical protein